MAERDIELRERLGRAIALLQQQRRQPAARAQVGGRLGDAAAVQGLGVGTPAVAVRRQCLLEGLVAQRKPRR
jgi:hypothetical protein